MKKQSNYFIITPVQFLQATLLGGFTLSLYQPARLQKVRPVPTKRQHLPSCAYQEAPKVKQVFPGAVGYFFESGRLAAVYKEGDGEERLSGQAWESEFLKDFYYMKASHDPQVLLIVASEVSERDILERNAIFWDGLLAFITARDIYILKRGQMGPRPFDERQVEGVGTYKEYWIEDFYHCRYLDTIEAAMVVLLNGRHRLLPISQEHLIPA